MQAHQGQTNPIWGFLSSLLPLLRCFFRFFVWRITRAEVCRGWVGGRRVGGRPASICNAALPESSRYIPPLKVFMVHISRWGDISRLSALPRPGTVWSLFGWGGWGWEWAGGSGQDWVLEAPKQLDRWATVTPATRPWRGAVINVQLMARVCSGRVYHLIGGGSETRSFLEPPQPVLLKVRRL